MILTPLRRHQVEALEKWRQASSPGFGLFMEQRTGKTLTALAIADEIKPSRLLIVCPPKAKAVWVEQMHQHWTRDWPIEVRLYTYGELNSRLGTLRRWITQGMIIADETHRIKARMTQASRRLRSLGKVSQWRLALTGTPVGQGLEDLWAQLDFLDPQILGKWRDFSDQFLILGGYRGKIVVGYQNKADLVSTLQKYSYRITLNEIQEKETQEEVTVTRFPGGLELTHYRDLERDLITYVQGSEVSTPLVITKLIKLQQLTGGFIITNEGKILRAGHSKERQLLKTLEHIQCPSKELPVVICVRFLHEMEHLRKIAQQTGKKVQTISGAGNQYDAQNPADWILIQVQAGESIDLSRARTVIFFSWDFSYLRHDQLRSRIKFYNAEKVSYHYLVMAKTIDELLLTAIRRKRKLAQLVCDYYRGKRDARNARNQIARS